MLKIHHLNFSRSTRVIWLMEELGEPYELVNYQRDPKSFRAPPSLEQVHPLAKAPVVEDGALKLAESGAILEYVLTRYGHGRLAPAASDPSWPHYIEWLHYAEGSAMLPLLANMLGMMTGGVPPGLAGFFGPEITKTLTYIAGAVTDADYLMGGDFTAADIQMSYVLEVARMSQQLGPYPALDAYMARLAQRPAYRRAVEVGGPVPLPL